MSHLQVTNMQQEHDKKQLRLLTEHSEQLKRAQLQAENELREVEHTHQNKTWAMICVQNYFICNSLIPWLHVENTVYEEWPWSSD